MGCRSQKAAAHVFVAPSCERAIKQRVIITLVLHFVYSSVTLYCFIATNIFLSFCEIRETIGQFAQNKGLI